MDETWNRNDPGADNAHEINPLDIDDVPAGTSGTFMRAVMSASLENAVPAAEKISPIAATDPIVDSKVNVSPKAMNRYHVYVRSVIVVADGK